MSSKKLRSLKNRATFHLKLHYSMEKKKKDKNRNRDEVIASVWYNGNRFSALYIALKAIKIPSLI